MTRSLSTLRDQLAELEVEHATLRSELRAFQSDYLRVVGIVGLLLLIGAVALAAAAYFALSVVAFVFGIAMLASPGSSLAAVINLLGLYLIVIGALRLLQASDAWYRQRRAR